MSWRTVVIQERCKLDLKLGYMVVRGKETRRVYLDEISILMIENPAVSLTGCFINTVIDHGLRVLMIEGTAYLPVKGEKRVTIDRDLCEF